jgi:hypothetical protein
MVSWGVIEKNKYIHWFKLIIIYTAIFATTHWYLSYYKNMLYSLSADEGIFLYGAKRVLDGQIIYRDFFSYFFPGNYYLLAFIYKIFGYSFTVAREAATIIDSLINVLVFYLSYKALKAWYAILPPLFYLILGFPNWIQFSHYWTGDLFLLFSLIYLLWHLEGNKKNYLYISAILLGFTTLFQQAAGVYGIIIFSIILLLTKRKEAKFLRSMVWFFVWIALPVAAMFGYIAVNGGIEDFIKQQMFIVLNVYPNVAAFSPFLFIFNKAYPINILIGIYFFGSIIAGVIVPVFYKRLSYPVIAVIIGNLILLLTISYSLDVEHIATAMPLFLIMVILPVRYFINYAKTHKQYLYKPLYYMSGIIGAGLLLWGFSSMGANIKHIKAHAHQININGTKVWMFSEERAYKIGQFLHEEHTILDKKKDVFVYPYAPLLYVLLDLNNPTHYDFIYIRLGIEGADAYVLYDIIKELQEKHVQYVIKHGWPEHYTQMLMSLKHITPYPTILDEFVKSNYTELWTIGEYGILKVSPLNQLSDNIQNYLFRLTGGNGKKNYRTAYYLRGVTQEFKSEKE